MSQDFNNKNYNNNQVPAVNSQYPPPTNNQNQIIYQIPPNVPNVNPFAVLEHGEVVLGCEFANKYKVYIAGPDGKKMRGTKSIYKIKEKGDCCLRQIGNWTPTDFEVTEKSSDSLIMRIIKPCGCFNCCCCFPEMQILDGTNQYMGKIMAKCSICSDNFDIYDHKDSRFATIYGECCQIGKYCRCPCDPCDKIHFEIIPDQTPSNMGSIVKKWAGCIKEMVSDADNFILNFPPNATLQQKMVYLGSVFLVDFIFFEEKQNRNGAGVH